MGSDCCAPATAESAPAVPLEALVCRSSCCVDSANNAPATDTSKNKDKDKDNSPDCCAGKTSPCCDTSCLDRLAVRECEGGGPDTCNGVIDGKACPKHSTSVLDRYSITLSTLGCICRALIALGEETCCDVRDRHSSYSGSGGGRRSKPYSGGSSRSSLESFGSSSGITKEHAAQNRHRLRGKGSGNGTARPTAAPPKPACGASCCSPTVAPPTISVTRKGKEKASSCCGKPSGGCSAGAGPCCGLASSANEPSSCCDAPVALGKKFPAGYCEKPAESVNISADSCDGKLAKETAVAGDTCNKPAANKARENAGSCSEPEASKQEPAVDSGSCAASCCGNVSAAAESCADSCCDTPATVGNPDTEAGLVAVADVEDQGHGREHVILSVSGMTCTGCETKLSRTLASFLAVKDLKTSLVLSRAEFNLDLRLGSVAEVIKHLERTTEFKCERIQNQGFSLDLIVPDGEAAKFINQTWPDGIIDITTVDKQTVRVTFDPKIVGARDLAARAWGEPLSLAPPRGDASLEAGGKHVKHMGWMTLLSAILTIPVLVMTWAPLPKNDIAYASASLALATVVQVVIGGPFYPKALKALVFSRVIEMDLLIVLSTSAAYVFSVVSFGYLIAGRPLSTGQFFETSTLLVTLIMVGRWVAALARQRAVETISLETLQALTAVLVDNGVEREIDVRLLQYGDVFKVLPDTKIPTDGTVISGSSETDESMLTGESKPVKKHPKSAVIAGSINGPGVLTVRLDRLPCDNTINTIAAMVNEAKLSKPKLQSLADQVACYFVPVVVTLTIITFVIWVTVGTAVRHQNGSEGAIQAITYAITVLIVSCPCAIGLAVPMVVVISSGVAAKNGIIFKSADAIEVGYKTSHVVFDKTGTLTRGKLSVTAGQCLDDSKLALLLGLVQNSRHPVSIAVATHLKANGVTASAVPEAKSLTGKGVETLAGDQMLQAGNSRWLNFSNHDLVQPMLANGYTVFCFAIDGTLTAAYGLEDELRPDASSTVQALKKRNITVHLVSGDDDGAVQVCAAKLNIPAANVFSRSTPAEKGEYVKKLSSVIFCGDGTNDAVALAAATIGVHMNQQGGADVAQSAADVVLMRPHLAGILAIMKVSRMSVRRIWFNFAWSFVYNTFAVLLAAGAFVHARIPPEFAGLGELVSVLPVIAASVLLLWADI
ncbi:ATPase, P-type, K/Mg/Cd/Cu/Zn/Na/Ca/Na/H-transporter [Cordyceps fumosorosea ARSEF 2679]|uniref:ATPase, P-type, K/Mg/Cd/Cu/Zn/Na/Ca/Na/H-transporter n=1 Tax=Cordyceps fumosorosea (strain ARSEF 2679) TaxID=1081104 RepID=A0A162MP11_CORFA|nr:ATPase, P-type, K/Mg/Cd/Cu/Zn/Na/Ca/Na/H-transporter [Cordyceps fumosorosea ARSEF 2679]OAA64760.1 ATPase, P-type, K/Mg/Cd/Cu/Zn/Na/Ca/Na/H-transporter [Cordyceps fumosorosea ARSEF 2679]